MFKKQFAFRRRRDDDGDSDHDAHPDNVLEDQTAPDDSSRPALSTASRSSRFDRRDTLATRSSSAGSTRKKNPLGITVVHRPHGKRTVDIVFVHGLGGSSRGTWTKHGDIDKCWPLSFLPSEPGINDARIMTFGYNSKFKPGAEKTQVSILDFAKDLLYDLRYAQDDTEYGTEDLNMGEVPIIFVVHSMGGLIVKEAYMQGQYDPTYEHIMKAVSSIVFLSTPHRGSNLAEILNRILQVSFVTSPKKFIAELSVGSQTLQKLNEQFRHVAPRLNIISFYETRPTSVIGMMKKTRMMVLEKDSSMLGYPGEVSKPLDSDHNEICKYEDPADHLYITVRNAIKSLMKKPLSKVSRGQGSESPITEKRQAIDLQEFLALPELPERDFTFFRDRRTPGTCDWILRDDAFVDWLEDRHQRPRVLWAYGNAASGKSILSSFVIDHISHLDQPCHYFFFRFTDQKKRGMSTALRSLACQLAYALPDYARRLRQLQSAAANLGTADVRNVWQWLYKDTLFRTQHQEPLYCVIDGVDEADSPGSFIKLLSEIHATALPLRFLIVSRKTHEISLSFQKLSNGVHLEPIRIGGNTQDFKAYIDAEMDIAVDGSYRDEVTTALLDLAKGNFLWLNLAVQKVNSCHTKLDVERALQELPPGMEALYGRMADSVQRQNARNRSLGLSILGWAVCARWVLSVEELSDALGDDGLLEIHRTIGDLCGGFVIVDVEGKVSLIHETAREYLIREGQIERSLSIPRRATNDKLLERCIQCLTDPKLRTRLIRNDPPSLLSYAVKSWYIHLALGSYLESPILRIVLKFLQGPFVLTWMYVAAKNEELRRLVVASRYLSDVLIKLRSVEDKTLEQTQAADVFQRWATDLTKVVAKFGHGLTRNPDAVHKLVPPFCPESSVIYQQFGRKESKTLNVSDFTSDDWDDCLTSLSVDRGYVSSSILPAGNHVVMLSTMKMTTYMILYDTSTFEEKRRIKHPERVLKIAVSKFGNLIVSYGYLTTRVWKTDTGTCIEVIKNPRRRPRPHTISFDEDSQVVLMVSEDRGIRSFALGQDAKEWEERDRVEEESLDDTLTNSPTCSKLSPDGTMIAFGYRAHPVTVWEMEPLMLVGQCNIVLDEESGMMSQEAAGGETTSLAWHPFSGDVFGVTLVGLLFRWNPFEDEPAAQTQSGTNTLALNTDGSLLASGDGVGVIKIYQSSDLIQLYQLSTQDPIASLSFSIDSRRIYDCRGGYCNIWEPSILARLAEKAEYPDHNSDSQSETESLTKLSLHTEHHGSVSDNVISLAGQSTGPLYCYGTENGVAALCEVGKGRVSEVERLKNFMPIEQVAWSEDGKYMATWDLNWLISVHKISRSIEARGSWTTTPVCMARLPPDQNQIHGRINHLLFNHSSEKLFAAISQTLLVVDISKLQAHDQSPDSEAPVHGMQYSGESTSWTCHPNLPEYLLGFTPTRLHVYSWNDLALIDSFSYFPPRELVAPSQEDERGHRSSIRSNEASVERLVTSADQSTILLKVAIPDPFTQQSKQDYLLFDGSDISTSLTMSQNGEENVNFPYTSLPPEVLEQIKEPFAFLSRRRLLFLDADRWICTWRPQTTSSSSRGSVGSASLSSKRGSESGVIGGIERHYMLPRDWMAAGEARLCCSMPDGTLLCPRNGDVATVQYAKLRK